jgi:L-amino acid N-acyltransferase YncA
MPGDYPAVKAIYCQGIKSGNATFETKAPDWPTWNNCHLHTSRLVAEISHQVVGWVALSKASNREVYAGVAEVSIYVDENFRNKGIGIFLLKKAIEDSEESGIWTLFASIFPENKASQVLHQKMGFRKIGYREKIGKLHGLWRDTTIWERRSSSVGL